MAIVLRPDSRQKTRRTLTIFAFFTGICLFALPGRAAEPASGPEIKVSQGDWPWWRGPGHDGIAEPAQTPPITWSDKQNIAWVAPVPGRGHGSPIVVGDQVVLATADKDRDVESVLCFDRTTGRQVWESVVFQGKLPKKMNEKASLASSTVACDGERFFINFLNDDAAWAIALDRQGGKLWQTRLTDYVIHQGYGSSPLLYGELVIVSADNKSESGGVIAALNRLTGEIVWKRNRPSKPNYPSPTIVHVNGRDQLIMTGCDLVTSLNPSTGEVLWEIDGATTECVTTTVTDGTHIFTSGGYPRNHIS
ncbi:MAG: PQQ-binding-like beta-propeller repeat protein, partial [Planctomycetaceae bacterium]|nr:PQQ-binding-like beta-propeller repeat protein [Planctomycetaceae bacterium]